MKLKQLFIVLLIINSIALMSVVFILSEYQKAITQLENAYIMKNRSFILADELRQSSDDLTRMARTYVITGDKMFEEQFNTVLDIRNGDKARPKDYNRIYWDFYTLKNLKPKLDGEKKALKTLLKEAGFPDEELALLYKSQKESDDLTNLEAKAMHAIKGIFQDKNKQFTIYSKPDFNYAKEIMHSQEYHEAKIAIMKPLNEFYKAFEYRTQQKVNNAHETVKQMETYLSYAVLFLIILFIFSFFFIILYRIIHPLEALNKSMLRLSKNNMNTILPEKVFLDEVGEMIGAVEIFKKNAIQLISSQQQNKKLLDLAGEGIFGLDSRGRFIFVNPTASRLLGYSSKELIGKYINKTIGKHIFKKGAQQKERLMLISKEEQTFISKNNKEFPIDYVSTPIFNNSETLEGSVVVFSDKTKRKEHEERLKKATLEAQNANLSKSVFLTNMSHELRTPLNAILGFTTLLKKSSSLNEIEKQNLQTIRNSGEHLLSIINEILEFAKIEAGKVTIKKVQTNLYNIIKDIELMFKERCLDKNLEFKLTIEKDVPEFIICDEKRVKQIFINILGNALKFTEEGKIETLIQYKSNRLKVKIQDSGIGMNTKTKELIFKPFEQLEESKHKQKGTGLGLSITKELIEKMNGRIYFESKYQEGTIFFFEIEVEKVKKIESTLLPNDYEIVLVNKKKKDIKILVADDIKINRDLLIQLLQTYDLKAYEAIDGINVLKECKKNKFDLIFMDILMPNLDGLGTIKKLRNTPDYKNTPIIAISANVFEEDKQNALSMGANYFLSKPFKENDITNILNKYLSVEFTYTSRTETKDITVLSIEKQLSKEIINAAILLDSKLIEEILERSNIEAAIKVKINRFLLEYKFDEIIKYLSKEI